MVIVFPVSPEMLGRGNILPGYYSLKQILWKFMKEEAKLFIRMTDSSRFSKTFLNSEMTEEKAVLLLSPVPWILPLLHYSSFSLQNIQVLPLRQIYSWASKGTQNSLPYSKTFLFQLSLFPSFCLQPSSSRTVISVHFVTAWLLS